MRHLTVAAFLIVVPLAALSKNSGNPKLTSNTRTETETATPKMPQKTETAKELAVPPKVALLAQGIIAVRGHMRHLKRRPGKALKLAAEALKVHNEAQNKWFSVSVLLGLAANESDYRWWLRRGLDCGICQNRVNLFCRSERCMRKLCKRLSSSSLMSFRYAMKELNGYRLRYCKRHKDGTIQQLRCVLNTYYQGPSWLNRRRRTCKLRREPWMSDQGYRNRVVRCIVKNRYWLRAYCFARGVELRRKSRWSCRNARSLRWIERAYRIKQKGTRS